ncbi:hypothetical protein P4678_07830 [Priestia megaterium]|uniref:hypothetical protein n=1 Tax=Priestia megaterium TaxID=1404 RepID=UPI002E1BDCFD|nr:hypothetical protein [Priestia megaterium]MED4290577.1 hypothetical protein [Priestia megaterium]MED4294549.1 hypothetical protein [Priestia megaterium]
MAEGEGKSKGGGNKWDEDKGKDKMAEGGDMDNNHKGIFRQLLGDSNNNHSHIDTLLKVVPGNIDNSLFSPPKFLCFLQYSLQKELEYVPIKLLI